MQWDLGPPSFHFVARGFLSWEPPEKPNLIFDYTHVRGKLATDTYDFIFISFFLSAITSYMHTLLRELRASQKPGLLLFGHVMHLILGPVAGKQPSQKTLVRFSSQPLR